jgi:hypothetical protein
MAKIYEAGPAAKPPQSIAIPASYPISTTGADPSRGNARAEYRWGLDMQVPRKRVRDLPGIGS